MASYEKRGKRWTAQVFKKGIRKKKTFDTKACAIYWANALETQIDKQAVAPSIKHNYSFKDALLKYAHVVSPNKKTYQKELNKIGFLIKNLSFINENISKITAQHIASFRDFRLQTIKNSSARVELALISNVFEIARKEWQWCKHNPVADIAKPKIGKPRDRRITDEEITLILETLNYQENQPPITKKQEIAFTFLIALETAMRCGEIISLKTTAINLEQKYLTLFDTKNGDKRYVPLSNKACKLLTILINSAKLNQRENLFDYNPVNFSIGFKYYCNKSGIINLHFHDTRHEAITRLAQKLDVLDLARMIGHRNINQLRTYYNATAQEIAKRLNG